MDRNEGYRYALQRASELLYVLGFSKRKKDYLMKCIFSMFACILLLAAGVVMRKLIILSAAGVFFILFNVYLVKQIVKDFKRHEAERVHTIRKYTEYYPRLLSELLKNCKIYKGQSYQMQMKSMLCGGKTDRYMDYGTYYFLTAQGQQVIMTHSELFMHIQGDNTIRQQSYGTLVCFPGVLQTECDEPVYAFYNEEKYYLDKNRELGLIPANTHLGRNFFHALESGDVIKHKISIQNDRFNHYYLAFASTKEAGEAVFTQDRVEKLIQLHDVFNTWFSISYIGRDVYVFMKGGLDFVVGRAEEPKINENAFQRFYRIMTGFDELLYCVME